MKKVILILLSAMLFHLPSAAVDNSVRDKKPDVSWGGKLGFTSCSTYLTNASVNGKELEEYSQDTQLGNFISVNMQYGYDSFFFQTGLGIGLNKSAFQVNLNEHILNSFSPDELELEYKITSIFLPVQIGYSVVNRPPYKMSVYAGPSMRIQSLKKYDCNVSDESRFSVSETPRRFLFGGTCGFCVQTGRTFFDMEYELVVSNISKRLSITKNGTELQDLKLGRRMGIFSFSYGILF